MIKKETGEKRQFSTGAKKQSALGKGTPVLFPPDAYLEISRHFEEGARIHGDRNWEKGIPLSQLINSLERHIAQEKMGLTDESHDRALAWNAVVYLATKLRIKAGVLPKELDDLCGAYAVEQVEIPHNLKIGKTRTYYYYIYCAQQRPPYLWRDLQFHNRCYSVHADNAIEGYYPSQKAAREVLQEYLRKGGD